MSLIPIFKKLYKKKEDFTAALKRHMVFYNTEAVFGSVINGITIAMEEQKQKEPQSMMKLSRVLNLD